VSVASKGLKNRVLDHWHPLR